MHCLLFQVDRCTWVGGLCRCKQLFQHMCRSHRQVDTLCSACHKLHHLHSPHCTDIQQRHRTAEGFLVYQVDIHIVLCGPGHGILHLFHTDFLTHMYKGSSSYHLYRPCHRHSLHLPYIPLYGTKNERKVFSEFVPPYCICTLYKL